MLYQAQYSSGSEWQVSSMNDGPGNTFASRSAAALAIACRIAGEDGFAKEWSWRIVEVPEQAVETEQQPANLQEDL